MNTPQVLIVVQGGVVTEVFSTDTLEVLILDRDEHPEADFETTLEKCVGELVPQALADATRQ